MIKKDVLVSVVQQSDSAIYMHTYLFIFKFFSQLGCYIILSRVPCAYLRNLKKKKVKMNLFAKQKKTHRLREQIQCYHWEAG